MASSKKKVYGGLMFLSAAALLVDRVLPGAGETVPRAVDAAPLSAYSAVTSAVALPIPELPFPRNIPPFDPDVAFRDPFDPPRPQSPDLRGPAVTGGKTLPGGRGGDDNSRAAFATVHKVDGVLIDERLKIAVVDGEFVAVGHSFDGCTLVGISDAEVRFECRDGAVSLSVNPEESLVEH